MVRLGLAIHEFRWANPSMQANSWMVGQADHDERGRASGCVYCSSDLRDVTNSSTAPAKVSISASVIGSINAMKPRRA